MKHCQVMSTKDTATMVDDLLLGWLLGPAASHTCLWMCQTHESSWKQWMEVQRRHHSSYLLEECFSHSVLCVGSHNDRYEHAVSILKRSQSQLAQRNRNFLFRWLFNDHVSSYCIPAHLFHKCWGCAVQDYLSISILRVNFLFDRTWNCSH